VHVQEPAGEATSAKRHALGVMVSNTSILCIVDTVLPFCRLADTELVPVCWSNKRRHHHSPQHSPRSIGAEPPTNAAAPEPVSQAGLLTYAVDVASSKQSSGGPPGPPAVLQGTNSSSHSAQPHSQQPSQTGGGSSLKDAGDPAHKGAPMLSAEREAANNASLEQGPQSQQRRQQRQRPSVWYRSWEVCQACSFRAVADKLVALIIVEQQC
jgi:hypothetical protein